MLPNGSFKTRWLGEVPVYTVALCLFALCIGLLASRGIYPDIAPIAANAHLYFLSILGIAAIDMGAVLIRQRPDDPAAFLKAHYVSRQSKLLALGGIPSLAILILLMPFFSKMKAAIPLFNNYTWDETFIAWDRALFGGYDAWEVLQPVLGFPIITAALAFLYQVWFLLLYPGCLFFAFARIAPTLRRQFFLTYVLSWTVIGGAMATWLASVGPCFAAPILGIPTFDAQMAYLNAANEQVPIMTLTVQEMLLDWFSADANGLGSGITAMPSMHVAIAFLFWLAVRQHSRRWGMAFGIFFAITWISSVHLAYHYAVDGLVSVIAVAALWKLSQVIITAWDKVLSAKVQPTARTNTVPAE
ncbi:hypothetical protein HKD42_03185 [Altererythrobacter sp. RZ02]|uniref:Inositolphosphotransferase Aur1/Ipt1 domain-containing protein n=1 Tax=Pontixanthobacter rizhaonensis TaxID=2730337 RepID=A0A848QJT9_9SPHN|nr:phosphatase PAP2 family protein [Pontixanthobacter rizhaonensis]NMW31059.1 hypothetical protein [Pontixanthobacter rizhaonensis]